MERSGANPHLLGLNLSKGKSDLPASSKARNIYRQPLSQSGRPRSNSCQHFLSENRRRQWMVYETWRTSLSDGAIMDSASSGTSSKDPELEADEEYRPRAVSTGAQEGSKLKPDNLLTRLAALRRKKSPTKHTSFCDRVSVHYYDGESEAQDTCELKTDQFISSIHVTSEKEPEVTDSMHKLKVTDTITENDVKPSDTDIKNGSIFLEQKITVLTSKSVDSRDDKVRITVKINDSCVHSKTSVKAMSGGKTLLLMAYKQETSSPNGKPLLHQFVQKLSLPYEVDPYGIRAFTYNTGNLVIEAPVFHKA